MNARQRWWLWGGAVALLASWRVMQPAADTDRDALALPSQPARPAPAPAQAVAAQAVAARPTGMANTRPEMAAGQHDPFRPLPKPVVAAPKPPPPASAPPPPPPRPVAPRPPTVPYRYIGQMTEPGNGGSAFLSLGEKLIHARVGDVLEGDYQLKSVAARELVFVNLKLNQTVTLPVDGETP
jgi:hypothetical protein